jgi:hypothetical protein
MQQIAILPAGCLISSKHILFSNENRIMYSSNLAVYALNAQTFMIEKIIAVTERTVASIAVSPHDNNLLVCILYIHIYVCVHRHLYICRSLAPKKDIYTYEYMYICIHTNVYLLMYMNTKLYTGSHWIRRLCKSMEIK